VRAGVFATVPGNIEELGANACTVRLSAESVALVVQFIAAISTLGATVQVREMSEEVTRAVRDLGARLTSA
jgi:hypothetical protein